MLFFDYLHVGRAHVLHHSISVLDTIIAITDPTVGVAMSIDNNHPSPEISSEATSPLSSSKASGPRHKAKSRPRDEHQSASNTQPKQLLRTGRGPDSGPLDDLVRFCCVLSPFFHTQTHNLLSTYP